MQNKKKADRQKLRIANYEEQEVTIFIYSPPMVQQPPMDQGLLIIETLRLQSLRHATLGRTHLDE